MRSSAAVTRACPRAARRRAPASRGPRGERVEPVGEEGVLARAGGGEQLAAGGRDRDQRGAAVAGIGGAGTSPPSSSRTTSRVTVGRWTRSASASSLGVSGPWRSIVASAAVSEGERSVLASWRRRRAVRVSARRRRVASSGRPKWFASLISLANHLSGGMSRSSRRGENAPTAGRSAGLAGVAAGDDGRALDRRARRDRPREPDELGVRPGQRRRRARALAVASGGRSSQTCSGSIRPSFALLAIVSRCGPAPRPASSSYSPRSPVSSGQRRPSVCAAARSKKVPVAAVRRSRRSRRT